jgi:ABC-type sugar transport system permease subunit
LPRHRHLSAWLFTLPGLLAQFLFGWFPVLFAFVVGFQRYYFVKDPEFVGTRNFRDVAATR